MRVVAKQRLDEGVDRVLALYSQFEERLDGRDPSFLHRLRRDAIDRFSELGFPSTRHEEWRFTNIAPIARGDFEPPRGRPENRISGPDLESIRINFFADSAANLLVLVDGEYALGLSSMDALPAAATAVGLADALAATPEALEPFLGRLAGFSDASFTALNSAFIADGAFIHVPRGIVVEEPIFVLNVSTSGSRPTLAHPRTLVVLEEHAQASVVEIYAGGGGGFTNAVTEVVVGDNAVCDHVKAHDESEDAFHVATMQVRLGRSSSFRSHSITLGGGIVRNDVRAVLDGEGSECTLNGLYLASGQQLVDNHTYIDHASPHCNSHEVYHGILGGHAAGVFNGKIMVRPDAQKTDAKQTNRTLLLSPDAVIDTKPQLEIFADDVKCTHGATVGQLDDEAVFYIQTRGIEKAAAKNILTLAFAREIIDRININSVQQRLQDRVFAWLSRVQG